MSDIIKQAIAVAKNPTAPVLENISEAVDDAESAVQKAKAAKAKLPTVKNKILAEKQKKAKARKKAAEAKEKALKAKNNSLKNAKSAAKSAAKNSISTARSSIPKPPIQSEKILQNIRIAKQAKQIAQERKSATLSNIQQNKEQFKFPMKLPASAGLALPLATNLFSAVKQVTISRFLKPRTSSPTSSIRDKYCNSLPNSRARLLCKSAYNEGITDKTELAQFIAQAQIETLTFSRLQENLNYSTTAQLLSTFSKLKTVQNVNKFIRNPIQLANFVYSTTNGNKNPGDGYTFRGRGFIQLTGRGLYKDFGDFIGKDVISDPDYLSKQKGATESAIWYWKTKVRPRVTAFNDVVSVTRVINPALKSLAERANAFSLIYEKFTGEE
jgi:putative chitinase